MVGDINLFLLSPDAAADAILAIDAKIGSNKIASSNQIIDEKSIQDIKVAEVDVMIAERANWRSGYGSQALGLILQYGVLELGIK